MYEFTFNLKNQDPLYITHNTPHLDNELLQFLQEIELDFNLITNFKVNAL